MSFDVFPFKKFAYRNSLNLQTFNISPEFVYITTHNEVHQYKKNMPAYVSCDLPFKPLLTFFHRNVYFICSQTGLYYFQNTLHHIMQIRPLALNFEYKGLLLSISESAISQMKIPELATSSEAMSLSSQETSTERCHCIGRCMEESFCSSTRLEAGEGPAKKFEIITQKLSSDNGVCSAQCCFNSKLVLGFENGVVGYVESDLADEARSASNVLFHVLSRLNEPVISMCCGGGFIYASTLEHIFKIPSVITTSGSDGDSGNEGLFTKAKCKKIAIYGGLLLLQQDRKVAFFTLDLDFIDVSIFQLEIKNLEILHESLFIGFACGLLMEYGMGGIHRKLSELHRKSYLPENRA